MLRQFLIGICALLSVIVVLVISALFYDPPHAESKVFCAYNRVFVEFEDGRHKWGTILLDEDGKPISCTTFQETENIKGFV
jgi:hypothetical protein